MQHTLYVLHCRRKNNKIKNMWSLKKMSNLLMNWQVLELSWTISTASSSLHTEHMEWTTVLLLIITQNSPFKGTVSQDFLLQVFFHESSSPKPLKVTLGSFQIFSKFLRYSQVKVHHWYKQHFAYNHPQICLQFQIHQWQIRHPY
jgi:hypothetical protein